MSTITVNTNPLEPVVEPTSGIQGDDIAARRAALFQKFEQSAEAAGTAIDFDKTTDGPVEQVDSIVLSTPRGEIEFGPPSGVSLTLRVATMMGEDNPNRIQSAMLRVLMSVRSIDGQPVAQITSMVGAQGLANRLGDPLLDYLYTVMLEYWPPYRRGDLQVLRKNKRIT